MRTFTKICITAIVLGIVSCSIANQNAFGKSTRHLTIHGGMSVFNLESVAENVDVLIVSTAKLSHLQAIKRINPEIVLLRYNHGLGTGRFTPGWEFINSQESWFVHDKLSGERLKAKKYGWLLMNIADSSWQDYSVQLILNRTDDLFDGIFLDDYWPHYVNKFVSQHSGRPAVPLEDIVNEWDVHLISRLKKLRSAYPKKLFTNGAYEKYLPYLDGCMEEGYVHANWHPEAYMPSPSSFIRSIRKIERLKKFEKLLLLQSGSTGDGSADMKQVYDFCLASYFLLQDGLTSFGFHPLYTYYFKRFPVYDNYQLDIGRPIGKYFTVQEDVQPPNLLPDGGFEFGLQHWKAISGSPVVDYPAGKKEGCVLFNSRSSGRSDKISSGLIPVSANTAYRLQASCKTEKNQPGSKNWARLGLQGRFYDRDKNRLPGAYDLKFAQGKYDWLPFEITHKSPQNAAFFVIRVGFIGDGKGKGWVDRVSLTEAKPRAMVLRRDFSKGIVLVNYGEKSAEVTIDAPDAESEITKVTIHAHHGKIISNNGQNPVQ